ncbi:MAG: sulfurtransferase TusA family protein [Nitrospinota bacterium]
MDIKADHTIDIQGEVCPYTFVESKLKIESINSGEILKIILDHQPASINVPKSLQNEGHEIVKGPDLIGNNLWEIYVKKK